MAAFENPRFASPLLVWMYSKNTKNAREECMVKTEMKLDVIKSTGSNEKIWHIRGICKESFGKKKDSEQ